MGVAFRAPRAPIERPEPPSSRFSFYRRTITAITAITTIAVTTITITTITITTITTNTTITKKL